MDANFLFDLFNKLDTDHNHCIDKHEFSKFGELCGSQISQEDLQLLLEEIDKTGGETEGVLSFREFSICVNRLFDLWMYVNINFENDIILEFLFSIDIYINYIYF